MKRDRRWRRVAAEAAVLAVLSTMAFGMPRRVRTSWLQSGAAQRLRPAADLRARAGPSPSIRFPSAGPYDTASATPSCPRFIERLDARGYRGRRSRRACRSAICELIDRGVFPIYARRPRPGLTLLDQHGAAMFAGALSRARSIPTSRRSRPGGRHPAVHREPRAARSADAAAQSGDRVGPAGRAGAAARSRRLAEPVAQARRAAARSRPRSRSTATRRSAAPTASRREAAPDGLGQPARLSRRPRDQRGPAPDRGRLSQLDAAQRARPASARSTASATACGPGSAATSSTPTGLLRAARRDAEELRRKARFYKQVLSLLLAQRRPAYYLVGGRADLDALADGYLRLLRAAGVIDDALGRGGARRTAASSRPSRRRRAGAAVRRPQGRERDPHRAAELLGMPGLYRARPARPDRRRPRSICRRSDGVTADAAAARAIRRRRASSASTATACSIPAARASR